MSGRTAPGATARVAANKATRPMQPARSRNPSTGLAPSPVRTAVAQALRSAGRPLEAGLRGFLETGIGRVDTSTIDTPRAPLALPIARADDALERDADRAAQRIAAMAMAPSSNTSPSAKSSPSPSTAERSAHVPFRPDLSRVRIHTGPAASAASHALRAHAFSVGDDVFFGEGGYRPGQLPGLRLLAHEIAHVAQRLGGRLMRKGMADQAMPVSPADADLDDKDESAEAVALQSPVAGAAAPVAAPAAPIGAAPDTAAAPAAASAAPSHNAALAAPPGVDGAGDSGKAAQSPGELPTGDLGLIDEEIAEHERWGAAAQKVGAAGSAERAAFIADQAGEGSAKGFKEGVVQGAKTAVAMKLAEKAIAKGAVAIATRLGAQAAKFTPLPGIGAVIGGVMAGIDLAKRDWGATGKQIAGFGKGADVYKQLANSLEAISTVIEVATQVANVIAGILGAITVIMWIAAVATAGVISPMAATLTSISLAIGIGTMVLDGINAIVLKELITMFRALHAFASDADPRDVVAQGQAIEGAAGAATGFVGGLVGAKAAEKGMHLATPKPPPKVPGHANPPAAGGEGPSVKAEPPTVEANGATAPAAAAEPAVNPSEPVAHNEAKPTEPTPSQPPVASEPATVASAESVKPIEVQAVPAPAAVPEAAAPATSPHEAAAHGSPVQEPPAHAPTAAEPAVHEPAVHEPPVAEQGTVASSAEPAAAALPDKPPTDPNRQQKGEAVWAATEQLGEKFSMDAGVSPGDRIRLERRARTAKLKYEQKMKAAGFELTETGKEVSNKKWLPGEGKANQRRRAAAEAKYKKQLEAIATDRQKLQLDARKKFFAGEQGKTTMDIDAWHPEADAVPGAPITKPFVPDVTLPLAEPTHVAPGVAAKPGVMGRHSSQPPRGANLISEHVGPGAQYEALSTGGKEGPIYNENQYLQDKTLLVDKEVADIKTHEGPNSDNKRTAALKAKAARGDRVDPVADIYLPSLEQTFYAMDKVSQRRAAAAAPGGTAGALPHGMPATPTPSAPSGATAAPAGPEPATHAGPAPEATPTSPEAVAAAAQPPYAASAPVEDHGTSTDSGDSPHSDAPATDADVESSSGNAAAQVADGPAREAAAPQAPPAVAHPPSAVAHTGPGAISAAPTMPTSVPVTEAIAPNVDADAPTGNAPPPSASLAPKSTAHPSTDTAEPSAAKPSATPPTQTGAATLATSPTDAKSAEGVKPADAEAPSEGGDSAAPARSDEAGPAPAALAPPAATITSSAPVVEHVNPAYQPPPGTPDDLASLRNQIIDTLQARAVAEQHAQAMGQQKRHHEANEKPLADMKGGTAEAMTATEAHRKAIANRDEANERKKAEESKAHSKVDDYASRAGRLTSLTVPLKGLARFTGLASSLPNEPDFVLRFRTGVLKMNTDANRFLGQLDQMDAAMADQKTQQVERQKGVEADGATLKQTDAKANASAQALQDAKQTNDDFDQKNQERKEDAAQQQKGAQQTAASLGAQARARERQAVSLAAAMQFWAHGHAKARADAVAATTKRLAAMGYRVTEVREK